MFLNVLGTFTTAGIFREPSAELAEILPCMSRISLQVSFERHFFMLGVGVGVGVGVDVWRGARVEEVWRQSLASFIWIVGFVCTVWFSKVYVLCKILCCRCLKAVMAEGLKVRRARMPDMLAFMP